MKQNFLKTFLTVFFVAVISFSMAALKSAVSQEAIPQKEAGKSNSDPIRQKPGAVKAPKSSPDDSAPTATIIVKDGSTSITIKGLNLSGDQMERLKETIEDKSKISRLPDDLNVNMTIKITDKMLKKAGIAIKGDEKDSISDEDDEQWDSSRHFYWDRRDHKHGNRNVKIFSDLTVKKGDKIDEAVVIGGNLKLDGEINSFVVIMGNADIGPEAKVNGDFVVIFGSSNISPTAVVSGNQISINGSHFFGTIFKTIVVPGAILSAIALSPLHFLFKIGFWLVLFGFALLLFAIFPITTAASKSFVAASPLDAFGFGLLGLIAVLPISLVLLISIIGIPLFPVFIILLLIALFGGYAIGAFFLGSLIMLKIFKTTLKWALLIGIVSLGLISLIPIIGCLVLWIVVTLGFGAVCYTLFNTIFKRKTVQTPPPPAAPPAP